MNLKRTKKGFTIVELVIVVGVIGILSAILIPTFVNLTENAKKAALQLNLRNAYSLVAEDLVDGFVGAEDTEGAAIKADLNYSQAAVRFVAKGGTTFYAWNETEHKYVEQATTSWVAITRSKTATTDADRVDYNGYYAYLEATPFAA